MEIQFEKGRDQDIDEIGRLYDDLCDYLTDNVNYPGWAKGVYPNRDTAVSGVEQGTLFVAKCGDKTWEQ